MPCKSFLSIEYALKARNWKQLNGKQLPSHKNHQEVKKALIKEFSEKTNKETIGKAYPYVTMEMHNEDVQLKIPGTHFAIWQPLVDGINFIQYWMSLFYNIKIFPFCFFVPPFVPPFIPPKSFT